MEATILIGLIAAGWMYNNNSEDSKELDLQKDDGIGYPTSQNIYESKNQHL